MAELLEPVVLGDGIQLRNRICMGTMTRNRCTNGNKPTQVNVKHYADRARDGTGLIVPEGTFICPSGVEWPNAPVTYNDSHAEAWAKVTSEVHKVGGKILFQPWHPGRIQNENMPMLKESGYPIYAPSKVPAKGGKYRTLEGLPGHTHNITEIDEPETIIEQYRHSVTLAKTAGFDGIELLAQGSQERPQGKQLPPKYEPLTDFGPLIKYPGSRTMLMVNHEYTVEEARHLIQKEEIDLVTFARPLYLQSFI
ncbi:hypothetical protein ASPNIDRAFT_125262 [Aspergillus niger ATCC 1015]|uniref:NADH:flavin oxidoreductase/NADH oxidase N-terminal domain-containing protein n=1 Tax=Aspergillus niger (strain ATCC 1015 / CBS 113.46 / FGSC A1144 / LSHB Ac4 / NCTC 3858a / NRRL 328 / USDA 3528.7) TaxID=380704 RepID=G3XU14_ASPNA|nr:hypothetical protein ASPNIDRAFT_125262 [Aspergillus niger ATCC 1015]